MKKLLLIGAILAIGTTSFAVQSGGGQNGEGDTMYTNNIIYGNKEKVEDAGGFGVIRDITSNDNKHSAGVALWRDKGEGWTSDASTEITLNVLEPIIIESEVDTLYVEAVSGDELQIGDLGFRVKGDGTAMVTFEFTGELFEIPGQADVKGHNNPFFEQQTTQFGGPVAPVEYHPELVGGSIEEIEIDLAFDLTTTDPGKKVGTIKATAMYE